VDQRTGWRQREPVDDEGGPTGSPHWSPTAAGSLSTRITRAGGADIYEIGASGGRLARITPDAASDTQPVWSHDGAFFTSSPIALDVGILQSAVA